MSFGKKCLLGERFGNRGWDTAVSPRCQFFPYPCWRTPFHAHSYLVPDSFVPAPRFVRASSQIRSCLRADAGASGPACAGKYRERFSLSAGPTGQPCAKDRRVLRKSRKNVVGEAAKLVGHREARRRFIGFVLPCQSLPKNRSHSCSKLGVKKPICIRSRMSVREKKRPSATSSEIFGLA